MKILVVAEYVRRFPWSSARWAADLGTALRARGNAVTVACDGVEDPSLFGATPLIVRRPRRTFRGSDPRGFQTWALDLVRTGGFDASMSLTPLVPADLWTPVVHGALALMGHLVRSHSPISAAMELAARPWLASAVFAESRARALCTPREGHDPMVARLGSLDGGRFGAPLGYASRLDPPDDLQRKRDRETVRGLMGISPERPVLLVSVVHPHRPGLAAMMRGFAQARAELKERGPVLLVMGRRAYRVHRSAHEAGCARFVRFVGGTARPELALAASDVALAPWSGAGEIGTGRFIADALRMSLPVLAHPDAPGAELIRPAHFGTSDLGAVLEDAGSGGWCRAIVAALAPERRVYASRAARDAGATLSLAGMALRVENTLRRATVG